MPQNLDPNVEFDDLPDPLSLENEPAAKPAEKVAAPPAVTHEQVKDLETKLEGKIAALDAMKDKAAVLDRIAEIFTGKKSDPREEFITQEIRRRLGDDLNDLAAIKKVLPAVLGMLNMQADEKIEERANSARDVLRIEMSKAGLDPDDDDAFGYMEEALTKELKSNKELAELWAKGQIKSAVTKAFDKVQSKLFAPIRNRAKKSAVNAIFEAPKASPRGPAGTPAKPGEGNKGVDPRDTSREGIRKLHDAAFDRLQELLDRE